MPPIIPPSYTTKTSGIFSVPQMPGFMDSIESKGCFSKCCTPWSMCHLWWKNMMYPHPQPLSIIKTVQPKSHTHHQFPLHKAHAFLPTLPHHSAASWWLPFQGTSPGSQDYLLTPPVFLLALLLLITFPYAVSHLPASVTKINRADFIEINETYLHIPHLA